VNVPIRVVSITLQNIEKPAKRSKKFRWLACHARCDWNCRSLRALKDAARCAFNHESRLRQKSFDHLAMNIGQPELASLIFERQLFVINSQKMQDGGVQVMNVNRIFGHAVTKIV
jgi:hypothetical protein